MTLHDETEDRPIIPAPPGGPAGIIESADRPGHGASHEGEPEANSTRRVERNLANGPRGVTTEVIGALAGDEGSLNDVLTDKWANGPTRTLEVAAS